MLGASPAHSPVCFRFRSDTRYSHARNTERVRSTWMGSSTPPIVNRNKDIQSMRKSPPPPHLSGPSGPEGSPAASRRESGTGQRTVRRPNWRTLALFSLVVLATSGWIGCERVSSGVDTGPSLTPEELPPCVGKRSYPISDNPRPTSILLHRVITGASPQLWPCPKRRIPTP